MAFNEIYQRQVRLLIRALPYIAQESCFALKGGTAINLFVRDMPRLSVDIDLTYLPVASRERSLTAIDAAMRRISDRIRKALPKSKIASTATPEGAVVRLLIQEGEAQVKIEVTPVLRGCVYQPQMRRVSPTVEDAYGFAEMRIVSFADLYGGKLVAALDRQHPRDFFDVRDLLANEGIDDSLRRAFIVYLLSHNRPMWEILEPVRKPIREEFLRGFEGMPHTSVPLAELESARERMIASVVGQMPEAHRRFLVSFERGEPDWALLEIPVASELPAVEWRQHNLGTLTAAARAELVSRLEAILFPASQSAKS